MEKLTFTIRLMTILVAFPVIMFTELTRNAKGVNEQMQNTTGKVSVRKSDANMVSHTSFATQVVYN